jgi:hypothetical protein
MAEQIVLDTGPIVALAHADAIHIVAELPIEFVAPTEVGDELDEGVLRCSVVNSRSREIQWPTNRHSSF